MVRRDHLHASPIARLALLVAFLAFAGRPASAASPLRSPDPEVRARAAREAGERGDRGAEDALIDLLRDRNPRVRLEAARALGRLGSPRSLRFLKVVAQTDFDPRVRAAAGRAVLRRDPRGYAAKLATADSPPVKRVEPASTGGPAHAALLVVGLPFNALRAGDSIGGMIGAGLRWRYVEIQYSFAFPAFGLLGQARLLPLGSRFLIDPYVGGGFGIAFNNRVEALDGPSASLMVGGGLRLQIGARFFAYGELMASWVMAQPRSPVDRGADAQVTHELRDFALPVLFGCGVELWP